MNLLNGIIFVIVNYLKLINCIYNDFGKDDIWIVQINNFSVNQIIEFSQENGFTFINEVRGFPDYYILQHHQQISKRSGKNKFEYQFKFDKRFIWASKQMELERNKRNDWFEIRNLQNIIYSDRKNNKNNVQLKDEKPLFNDELWSQEWYLDNENREGYQKLDLNVLPVYERGITGRGVRISVLDDGIEYTHDDLFPNYDPEISWDCNNDNADPRPNNFDEFNSHGTRCAGEIAMVANNMKCGVGIAYSASIGGIKLLGGKVYDLIEGMALGFAHDKVDIYSSSWGPTDDGKSLEGPGPLAVKAIERGIREGRNGKGVLYVWASGNGGSKGDNCNCDGYTSSIFTIAVGSVTQNAKMAWYGEMCSALLTVAYSSGSYEDKMIATTDTGNSCTLRHTGTSASAPLAAGILALGLEANPNLTWRDVQYLIIKTANYNILKNNEGWQKNKANLFFNNRFGFGLMNADNFVTTALNWTNVSPQIMDIIPCHTRLPTQLPVKNYSEDSDFIFRYNSNEITNLEHVQVKVDLIYTNRGDLEVFLISPGGTEVQLLAKRDRDTSNKGFRNWKFMSVATWGENPKGKWILRIRDNTAFKTKNKGKLLYSWLILYGIHGNTNLNKMI